jgi:hypothetical protein
MNYGRMSAIANRQRPTNASLTRALLALARRPPIINNFLTSMALVANAFWKHVPPRHDRQWPQQSSSFGFATATSKSALPGQLHGGNNVRLLLPACNTSRNAACAQQWWKNGNNRRWPHGRKSWLTRPTSNERQRPQGQKCWPTRPTRDFATRRPCW